LMGKGLYGAGKFSGDGGSGERVFYILGDGWMVMWDGIGLLFGSDDFHCHYLLFFLLVVFYYIL
jgi:hypothetical protein